MKTMLGSAVLSAGVLSIAAMSAQADHHMEMQFGPAELMLCEYKEGKDRDDLDDLTKAFNKWADKNDAAYTYWVLTPHYHEDASEIDFMWLGAWGTGAAMGAGYDMWMDDTDDVGPMFDDVMECGSALASVAPISVPEEQEDWDTGTVWFQRCEIDEGATLGGAISAHAADSAGYAEMGVESASWAFLPALGFGDTEVDYWHVQSWPTYSQLGAGYDVYFNKGGWKKTAEAMDGVTSCQSPNLYTFRQVRASES